MRSCQDCKLCPRSLRRPDPLVRVKMFRIENVVVFHRLRPVRPLPIFLSVKHMQVIMEHHSHLRLMPLNLPLRRHRNHLCIFPGHPLYINSNSLHIN